MLELKRSLPLYKELGFNARGESQGYAYNQKINAPHPGLVFDKFIDTWNMDQGYYAIQEPKSKDATDALKMGSKRAWLEETIKLVKKHKSELQKKLDVVISRHRNLIKDNLHGEWEDLATDWRFVSGLGNGHPFETGFIWHRTLGVPYLPGSSVKGMIRAWAEQWDKESVTTERVTCLFGPKPKGDEARENPATGSLIVFDALPIEVPDLELDIMNPHYGDYYAGEKDGTGNPIPPADYLSPSPVFFLAVASGQPFEFALAPRPGAYRLGQETQRDDDLEKGFTFLGKALSTIGAGGKTAVGYGSFY